MQVDKLFSTFLLSMLPFIELRGGLPYGIAMGLPYAQVITVAILGNLMPVPFIIIYIRRIFAWLRKRNRLWNARITALEKRGHLKGRVVQKYSVLGLCLLVAIPLPGTGAWTGALVAAVLDIRLKRALPPIVLGVVIAAVIMTAATFGVVKVIMN